MDRFHIPPAAPGLEAKAGWRPRAWEDAAENAGYPTYQDIPSVGSTAPPPKLRPSRSTDLLAPPESGASGPPVDARTMAARTASESSLRGLGGHSVGIRSRLEHARNAAAQAAEASEWDTRVNQYVQARNSVQETMRTVEWKLRAARNSNPSPAAANAQKAKMLSDPDECATPKNTSRVGGVQVLPHRAEGKHIDVDCDLMLLRRELQDTLQMKDTALKEVKTLQRETNHLNGRLKEIESGQNSEVEELRMVVEAERLVAAERAKEKEIFSQKASALTSELQVEREVSRAREVARAACEKEVERCAEEAELRAKEVEKLREELQQCNADLQLKADLASKQEEALATQSAAIGRLDEAERQLQLKCGQMEQQSAELFQFHQQQQVHDRLLADCSKELQKTQAELAEALAGQEQSAARLLAAEQGLHDEQAECQQMQGKLAESQKLAQRRVEVCQEELTAVVAERNAAREVEAQTRKDLAGVAQRLSSEEGNVAKEHKLRLSAELSLLTATSEVEQWMDKYNQELHVREETEATLQRTQRALHETQAALQEAQRGWAELVGMYEWVSTREQQQRQALKQMEGVLQLAWRDEPLAGGLVRQEATTQPGVRFADVAEQAEGGQAASSGCGHGAVEATQTLPRDEEAEQAWLLDLQIMVKALMQRALHRDELVSEGSRLKEKVVELEHARSVDALQLENMQAVIREERELAYRSWEAKQQAESLSPTKESTASSGINPEEDDTTSPLAGLALRDTGSFDARLADLQAEEHVRLKQEAADSRAAVENMASEVARLQGLLADSKQHAADIAKEVAEARAAPLAASTSAVEAELLQRLMDNQAEELFSAREELEKLRSQAAATQQALQQVPQLQAEVERLQLAASASESGKQQEAAQLQAEVERLQQAASAAEVHQQEASRLQAEVEKLQQATSLDEARQQEVTHLQAEVERLLQEVATAEAHQQQAEMLHKEELQAVRSAAAAADAAQPQASKHPTSEGQVSRGFASTGDGQKDEVVQLRGEVEWLRYAVPAAEAHQQQAAGLQEELQRLRAASVADAAAHREQVQQLQAEVQRLRYAVPAAEAHQQQATTLQEKLQKVHVDSTAHLEQVSQLQGEVERLRGLASTADVHQSKVAQLQGEVERLQQTASTAETYQQQATGLQQELQKLTAKAASDAASHQEQVAHFQAEVERLQKAASAADAHQQQATHLQSEVTRLRGLADAAETHQSEVTRLQGEVERLRSMASAANVHENKVGSLQEELQKVRTDAAADAAVQLEQVNQLQGEVERLNSLIGAADAQQSKVVSLQEELQKARADASADAAMKLQQVTELQGDVERLQNRASAADAHQSKAAELQSEVERLRSLASAADSHKSEVSGLQEELQKTRANAAADASVKLEQVTQLQGEVERLRSLAGAVDVHQSKAVSLEEELQKLRASAAAKAAVQQEQVMHLQGEVERLKQIESTAESHQQQAKSLQEELQKVQTGAAADAAKQLERVGQREAEIERLRAIILENRQQVADLQTEMERLRANDDADSRGPPDEQAAEAQREGDFTLSATQVAAMQKEVEDLRDLHQQQVAKLSREVESLRSLADSAQTHQQQAAKLQQEVQRLEWDREAAAQAHEKQVARLLADVERLQGAVAGAAADREQVTELQAKLEKAQAALLASDASISVKPPTADEMQAPRTHRSGASSVHQGLPHASSEANGSATDLKRPPLPQASLPLPLDPRQPQNRIERARLSKVRTPPPSSRGSGHAAPAAEMPLSERHKAVMDGEETPRSRASGRSQALRDNVPARRSSAGSGSGCPPQVGITGGPLSRAQDEATEIESAGTQILVGEAMGSIREAVVSAAFWRSPPGTLLEEGISPLRRSLDEATSVLSSMAGDDDEPGHRGKANGAKSAVRALVEESFHSIGSQEPRANPEEQASPLVKVALDARGMESTPGDAAGEGGQGGDQSLKAAVDDLCRALVTSGGQLVSQAESPRRPLASEISEEPGSRSRASKQTSEISHVVDAMSSLRQKLLSETEQIQHRQGPGSPSMVSVHSSTLQAPEVVA